MFKRSAFFAWTAFALSLLWLHVSPLSASAQPDFTFIQVSDQHYNHPTTEATMADLISLRDIPLKPYHVTALPASFVIETGDMTEFGPKAGAWDAHNRATRALGIPCYPVLGNHDMTWSALSHEIALAQGREYYSWNNFGCHFVVLRSAGIQDPRPALEPHQLEWLKNDLAAVAPDTPVFLCFHHPLDSEFSGRYETDRLIEVIRPYNIAAILVGHSHTILRKNFEGFDMIRGGSTWGPCVPGCMVYSVLGDTLRVAYRMAGHAEATIPILEKPLHPKKQRPLAIQIVSPQPGASCVDEVSIAVRSEGIAAVTGSIDGGSETGLTPAGDGLFTGKVSLKDLTPGVHYVRVSGASVGSSVAFRIPSEKPKVKWSVQMLAASKSTPAISESAVYVGANDGFVRAYSIESGSLLWRFPTGGAVTVEPLVVGDRIYFGSEDANFYCITTSGALVWKYPVGSPIYSSAVTDGKSVYFGCCSGAFYSLDAASGGLNWVNRDATYTIECKPFLADGRVYYGAWDTYVYCVALDDGKLVWKCVGQGSAEGMAPAYYSPADCGPVVCDGKVLVPDRKYRLSIIDAAAGRIDKSLNSVSAVALSADGRCVYARKLDGKLEKLDKEGNVIWTTPCRMDDVAAAPREVDGVVYVSARKGLVTALQASDGIVLWQYQATPQTNVLSSVSAAAGTACVSGMDGSLTAIGQ
jgi:outer membrane protein assembly factor BamB